MKASMRQNMKPLNSTACFCCTWKCPCCHLQPPLMFRTSVFMGCCLPRRATMYLCRSPHRGYLHLLQELLSPFIPQHKREIEAFIPASEPENILTTCEFQPRNLYWIHILFIFYPKVRKKKILEVQAAAWAMTVILKSTLHKGAR